MITSGINTNLTGFAKAPRCIVCTEYFHDGRLLRAWVAIMISMRFTPIVIDGIPLEVGDALFTKKEISELFGVDKRAVRTILDRMSRDGFIKWTSIRNKYTLVSVIDPMLTSFTITEEEEEDEARELRAYRENVNRERMKNMTIAPSLTEYETDEADDEAVFQEEGSKKSLLSAVEDCEDFDETATSRDSTEKREDEAPVSEEKTEKVNIPGGKDAPKEKEAADKKEEGLGIFGNVNISESEMESLKKTMPGYYEIYIDKLSAYMKNAPEKNYKNHCAVILSWFMRDKAEGKLPCLTTENERDSTYTEGRGDNFMRNFPRNCVSTFTKSTACTTDPTASYDITEAQRRAMAGVPTSTKRRR
ncbi:MAG: hypothetical protein IJA39_05690 [Clostridia bacterium]|nr:hypothetical protein [Clostridia bacterium]